MKKKFKKPEVKIRQLEGIQMVMSSNAISDNTTGHIIRGGEGGSMDNSNITNPSAD